MVDPETLGTGAIIAGGGYLSKDLLNRLLGPTAEYMGDGLRNWTEKGYKNLARIFDVAGKRLGEKINDPGLVPPRVLKEVLTEGPFCEDELMTEYFGGVLASSRSGVSRDDRGARFAAMVGRLSTYQVRAHFVLYTAFRQLFEGTSLQVSVSDERDTMRIYISADAMYRAMEMRHNEDYSVLMSHCLFGLCAEGLLDQGYISGSATVLKANGFPGVTEGGLVVGPSPLGIELFLWAHGQGHVPIRRFLNPAIVLNSDVRLEVGQGVTVQPPALFFAPEGDRHADPIVI